MVPSIANTSKFRETVGGPARASSFGGTGMGGGGSGVGELGGLGAGMGNQMMSSYSNSGSRVVIQDLVARSPLPKATSGTSSGGGGGGMNSSFMHSASGMAMVPQSPAYSAYSAAPSMGTPLGTMLQQQQQYQQQYQLPAPPAASSSSSVSVFGGGQSSTSATYAPGDRRSVAPTPDGLGVRYSSGMTRTASTSSPLSRGLNNSVLRSTPGKEVSTPGTATRQSVSRLQRLGGDIKALASKLDAMSSKR